MTFIHHHALNNSTILHGLTQHEICSEVRILDIV